jgi:hypothetical protein
MRRTDVDAGFENLQGFLLAMAPGDEVSARQAAEISGLDHEQCHAILDALVRVGLMMRLQHEAYIRCHRETNEEQSA